MDLLWVGLAGGLGTVARVVVGSATVRLWPVRIPLGTLAVNVVGAFLIGLVVAWAASRDGASRMRLVLATGFLGGFTTYSAFALETVQLLQQRRWLLAIIYVSATLLAAGLACFIGLSAMRDSAV